MLKRALFTILSLALLGAACAQSSPSGTPASASQTPVQPRPLSGTVTRQPGCTVRTTKSTPNPTQEAILPPPGADDWVKGPADASVTLIEYSDFQ